MNPSDNDIASQLMKENPSWIFKYGDPIRHPHCAANRSHKNEADERRMRTEANALEGEDKNSVDSFL